MKIGLVLSGGGGKGAYELGVWKALNKLDLSKHISVFSGTSIGAFNAVLFAMGDIENAEKLWEEVTMEQLVPLSKLELFKRGIGLYLGGKNLQLAKKFLNDKLEAGAISNEGAIEIMDKYLDCATVFNNNKTCYVACTNQKNFGVRYFKLNDYDKETASKMVLASASLPLIYESTEVLGEKYVDGGIADNIPIQPVYGEKCDIIIVVLLSKDVIVDRSLYPNSKLIIIEPENLDESTLDGVLNLDSEAKRNRIKEGYNDTMNKLLPIIELAEFSLIQDEKTKNPKLYKMYNYLKNKVKGNEKPITVDNTIDI